MNAGNARELMNGTPTAANSAKDAATSRAKTLIRKISRQDAKTLGFVRSGDGLGVRSRESRFSLLTSHLSLLPSTWEAVLE